jgi:hypothetical protein
MVALGHDLHRMLPDLAAGRGGRRVQPVRGGDGGRGGVDLRDQLLAAERLTVEEGVRLGDLEG